MSAIVPKGAREKKSSKILFVIEVVPHLNGEIVGVSKKVANFANLTGLRKELGMGQVNYEIVVLFLH